MRDGGPARRPAVVRGGRGLGPRRRDGGRAAVAAARRPQRADAGLRVERGAGRAARSARGACAGAAGRGRAGGEAALPPRRLARRRRGRRGRARRGRRRRWRSWSTPTTAGGCPATARGRWDVPKAIACARALEPLGMYWLEEPLPTGDVRGLRAAAGRDVAADRGGRDGAERWPRRATSCCAAASTCVQPDVVLAGGIGGGRRIAALADLCGRTWSPHTWSNGLGLLANLHLALAVSTCPFLEVPLDPPGWSPARRDWLLAAATCWRSRRTGRSARPTRPGPGRRARPRRAGGAPRRMRIRAAVLHAYSTPLSVEEVELEPPRAGEVLVRVAAAGVCHSDLHLADGHLGPGRVPMVLGHEGAGVVEAVGEGVGALEPGDHVAFCFVPVVRALPRVRGRAAQPLRGRRASWRGRGCCSTARAGCGSPTAGPRSTSTSSPASRSGPSCPRRARCRSRGRCRCGRRRCSAAAW